MISFQFSQSMAAAIVPFIPKGVYADIAMFLGLQALGKHEGRFLRFSRRHSIRLDVFDDGICMPRSAAVYFRKVLVRTCVIVDGKDRKRLSGTTRQAIWRRIGELDVWLDSEGLGPCVIERLAYADKGEPVRRRRRKRRHAGGARTPRRRR